ncbi:transposase [Microbacterium maritypicum]
MVTVPKVLPKEFRNDVIAVARRGEAPISRIAKDFGVSESFLQRWLKIADAEDGIKPGVTQTDATELREARKRIRLLGQQNEILRRAAAYLSQASLPK